MTRPSAKARPLPMLFFASSVIGLPACGKKTSGQAPATNSPPSANLADGALGGTIDGKAWSMVTGTATPDANAPGQLMFRLSDAAVSRSCDTFAWPRNQPERSVIFSAAATAGLSEDRNLASGKSLTIDVFTPPSNSDNRDSFGSIALTTVTRAAITGKISARFDDSNVVQGSFTARLCASDFGDTKASFQADPAPDAALVGTWTGPIGVDTTWIWTLSFLADGTASAQLRVPPNQVFEDGDETWSTDSGTTPKRLIRRVTKVRTDTNGLEAQGDVKYCVYGPSDDSKSMIIGCRSMNFPTDLPAAADADMVLRKK